MTITRLMPVWVVASVWYVLLPSTVHAQQGDVRYGPWVTVGAGLGVANISCGPCPDGQQLGFAGFLEAGGTPSEQITLGINGSMWASTGADTTRNVLSISAILYFYPSVEQQSYFVKVGGGVARYTETAEGLRLTSSGFTFRAGAGYEIPGSGHIHFAPSINFSFSPALNAKRNLVGLRERIRVWTASVAFTLSWRK